MIDVLLRKGMNPNSTDYVRLSSLCDIEVLFSDSCSCDVQEGLTPLHIAATEGHLTVVQELVEEYGVPVQCISEVSSPSSPFSSSPSI